MFLGEERGFSHRRFPPRHAKLSKVLVYFSDQLGIDGNTNIDIIPTS